MDLAALRYFVVAARRLHFGQAAEEMGIAQPALSQRIKTLEERLGVRLFDRSRRAIQLTEAGRILLEEAERLLRDAQHVARITQAADKGAAGDLHIGYSGSVIFEPTIGRLLRAFRVRYPDASLEMHESSVEEQLDGVQSGKMDAAILWGPLGRGYPDLRGHVVARTSMSVVLGADHPLAQDTGIALEDLRREAFIALIERPGRGLSHVIDGVFDAAGFEPNIALRVSSLLSVFGLVGVGMGIGIVPAISYPVSAESCVQQPLKDVGDCNELLLVTRKGRAPGLARNFEHLVQELRDRSLTRS